MSDTPPPAPVDTEAIKEKVVETIRTIFDPEIPVNIYDMGMIYEVDVKENAHVAITMTLTSPACPVAGTLPPEVEQKVHDIAEVNSAKVELVWDPPWTMEKMSEAAKLQLGLM